MNTEWSSKFYLTGARLIFVHCNPVFPWGGGKKKEDKKKKEKKEKDCET